MRRAAPHEVSAGLLVVGLHAGEEPPASVRAAAEPALSGGDFSGKEGETALLYADLAAPRLLLIGLGDRSSFTLQRLRRTAAIAARRARSLGAREAALVLREPGSAGTGPPRGPQLKERRSASTALPATRLAATVLGAPGPTANSIASTSS